VPRQLAELGLEKRRSQRAGTLSGGWKQRLALAVATIHDPPLLLLDEPTAGVDPESRRHFWEEIFGLAGSGTTILVSTHYMDEAVRCHRLCMMLHGKIVLQGAPVALEEQLEGRVVEIETHRVTEVIDYLRTDIEIASIAQLGNRAHVLLTPEAGSAAEAANRLDIVLKAAGFRATARLSDPTLEDVFVAVALGENLAGDGR
ncbi:MAG: ABC transporter ATP-binding protein, partial [Thermoanaerobaculia bacterium]|nr:ABC transporter ATP-binding protein [Thermoanaerobaculia bacterium]